MTPGRAGSVTAATRVTWAWALATVITIVFGDAPLNRAGAAALTEAGNRTLRAARTPTIRTAPGPWGTLELTRIELDPPPSVVSRLAYGEVSKWSFASTDHAGVVAVLREATLTPTQIDRCERHGRWTTNGPDTTLDPPVDVVFALSPEARTRLYRVLATSPANFHHRNPMPVSLAAIAVVDAARLTPQTLQRFHNVLYGTGSWRMLSDIPALLIGCASPAERIRLMTAILRSESYVPRLVVTQGTDVETLLNYWSAHGRNEAIRPLLESIARLPGETGVDVRGLLPSWPSGHINRYPRPAHPTEAVADCFWTALNFFDDPPSTTPQTAANVVAALKTRYRPVSEPAFGDLVILLNGAGAPVHAGVFIADELVLTKNGGGVLRPWVYMKLPDVVDLYASIHGRLRTVFVTESRVNAAPR